MRLKELGALVGGIDCRSVGVAIQQFEQRCQTDPGLARLLEEQKIT